MQTSSCNQDTATMRNPPSVTLTQVDIAIVIKLFVDVFGAQLLYDHSELNRYNFAQVSYMPPWDAAIAMQIVIDTTAACDEARESVAELRKHFKNLFGDLKNEVLMYIHGIPFVIEKPYNPM